MSTKSLPDIFHGRSVAWDTGVSLDGGTSTVIRPPSRLFGENGHAVTPKRAAQLGLGDVPKRVPVHYHYREALGMAEVVYCFPVGQYVQLVGGGACLIEKVVPGTRFKLKDGDIATVTHVDPLLPWPEEHANDGKRQRRVVGKVKHTGAIVLDVTVGQSVLTCTPEHTFWSESRQAWVPAKSLQRGELLKGAKGQHLPVSSVGSPRKSLVDVHNLEIEIDHCYFVGNPPVLVHNGYGCIQLPGENGVELGRKLDYVFGQATGSAHNIERSAAMLAQMERIGLADSAASRAYLAEHLTEVANDASNILRTQANGRIVRESLLMGPLGGLKVESVWEELKLITLNLFGGG